MKRLTYPPKVYCFIRSSTENKTYDLSDLVVSGYVERRINAPSVAQVVLKNRDFILSPRNQAPRFLPMDGITIWLQRIPGYPVQVFTGYLDSVPQFQLLPGNATLTATCTLKRLMYTFFDPGVPAMLDWFAQHGWEEDPSSGLVMNPSQLVPNGQGVTDSGFGQLLHSFLTDVCHWHDEAILIGDLPHDIIDQGRSIYQRITNNSGSTLDNFKTFLSNLMGINVQHHGVGQTSEATIVNSIYQAASNANLDPQVLVAAALSLSGLNNTFQDLDSTSPTYGAGLFDVPFDVPPASTNSSNSIAAKVGGKETTDLYDPTTATNDFIKRLRDKGTSFVGKFPSANSDIQTLGRWIADAAAKSDVSAVVASLKTNLSGAQTLISAYGKNTNATTAPAITYSTLQSYTGQALPGNLTWDDAINDDERVSGVKYSATQKANKNLVDYLWVAHQFNLTLFNDAYPDQLTSGGSPTAGTNPITRTNVIAFSGSHDDLINYAKWAKDYAKETILLFSDKETYGYTGVEKMNPDFATFRLRGYAASVVYLQAEPNDDPPIWSQGVSSLTLNSDSTGDANSPTSNLTFSDLAKLSFNSSFAAQFSFSVNFAESLILTGNKSMMNDIQVIKGVEQIAAASMRTFMSLPTGEFAAFYPDYFGASGRTPYWEIDDIELMNMGIQLSDEPLATHVFVTGGTFMPGQINFINEILSQGVVTIDTVMQAANFVAGAGSPQALFGASDVKDFLYRFGARPLNVQQPVIRSHYFEFLYAWQLFMYQWAAMFQTTVEMTFQPEIMAGGLISFPSQGLQMYVENVRHTFDYQNGFTTDATLIAPAVTGDRAKSFPGMAIAGSVGSFGAITGIVG